MLMLTSGSGVVVSLPGGDGTDGGAISSSSGVKELLWPAMMQLCKWT